MSAFKRVIIDHGQAEIAKVNLKTRTLTLSPGIWKGLPADEKEFVLLHEKGHLEMQTADEFAANKYAVGQFMKVGTFTNKELGQRIMVMRSILDKADGKTASFTADIAAGAASGIMQTLSVLGIGSKARIREAEATAAANAAIYDAQAKATEAKSKSTVKILVVSGIIIILAVAIYFKFRKK